MCSLLLPHNVGVYMHELELQGRDQNNKDKSVPGEVFNPEGLINEVNLSSVLRNVTPVHGSGEIENKWRIADGKKWFYRKGSKLKTRKLLQVKVVHLFFNFT